MKRYRFEVEWENEHEWNVGTLRGADPGEVVTTKELVTVLRELADSLEETWESERECVSVAYPVARAST